MHSESDAIVIHLTINRQQINESFIEEINEFLDDQCVCLEDYFNSQPILK